MRKPDTTIPCEPCQGTGKHPRLGHQCGACFGFGLSTVGHDQRRNGTTITVWDGEELPAVLSDSTVHVHSRTATSRIIGGGSMKRSQAGVIMLVSWQNKDYRGN